MSPIYFAETNQLASRDNPSQKRRPARWRKSSCCPPSSLTIQSIKRGTKLHLWMFHILCSSTLFGRWLLLMNYETVRKWKIQLMTCATDEESSSNVAEAELQPVALSSVVFVSKWKHLRSLVLSCFSCLTKRFVPFSWTYFVACTLLFRLFVPTRPNERDWR